MPKVKVAFYREESGIVPILRWFEELPFKARIKCIERIERLQEMGHELRRPEADFLRDGIYELRASFQGIHYRMLYFFHGKSLIILSHGIIKERTVPPREIDKAILRKNRFLVAPHRHSYEEIGK